MISAIKGLSGNKAKTIALAAMLSLGAVTAAATTREPQKIDPNAVRMVRTDSVEKDVFIRENTADTDKVVVNDLKDAKTQWNDMMSICKAEDIWKGLNKGIDAAEYEKMVTFLNTCKNSTDVKLAKWADKKLALLNELKDSDKNQEAKNKELRVLERKINKCEVMLDDLEHGKYTPPSLLNWLLYSDEYKERAADIESRKRECRRDITYYSKIRDIVKNEVINRKLVGNL